jgi:hypothetical protein
MLSDGPRSTEIEFDRAKRPCECGTRSPPAAMEEMLSLYAPRFNLDAWRKARRKPAPAAGGELGGGELGALLAYDSQPLPCALLRFSSDESEGKVRRRGWACQAVRRVIDRAARRRENSSRPCWRYSASRRPARRTKQRCWAGC